MRRWTGTARVAVLIAAFALARSSAAATATLPALPPPLPTEPVNPPLYYRLRSPWLDPKVAYSPLLPQETSYAWATAEVLTVNVGLWGIDKLSGKPYADISLESWKQNFEKGWVIDVDDFWMNGLFHPLQGSFSYEAARSTGVGFGGAFGYAFGASLLWEELGENLPPSINDQINTPFGGSIFGEMRYRLHRMILDSGGADPGFWRRFFAFFIAPIAGLNELAFDDRFRGSLLLPVSWIGDFSIGAVATASAHDLGTGARRTGLGPWALFEVRILYGVPGTPGLRLEQPFDHFSLDLAISATGNRAEPALSFLTRGLVLGRAIGPGGDFGGLWGLFTSYDYIASGFFRVTGFGAGPGIALRQRLGAVDLYGTALVSFVPWGGAGLTDPLGSRDYDYGIGGEGLLSFRLDLLGRLTLRANLREFLVSDNYSRGRSEDISYLRLGAWVRIWGPHALGIESDWSRRNADTETGPVHQRGWGLSAQYTFLSGW